MLPQFSIAKLVKILLLVLVTPVLPLQLAGGTMSPVGISSDAKRI
jgi:hypothetical protein